MAARKSSPAVKAAIVEMVRNGGYAKHAAASAGIAEVTLYDWIKDDPAFGEAINNARADAQLAMVRVIRDAAPTDWKAAAWYLARAGDGFVERTAVEHSGGVTLTEVLAADLDEAGDAF